MRFSEVFLAAEGDEQPELILIRYWFHRATSRKSADAWLTSMLTLVDDDRIAAIQR
ncbi:MAG: hypothetical protein R3C59_17205 [Planctomycetaceae bacterium]